jgi:Tfp pilus assembly protein PilF
MRPVDRLGIALIVLLLAALPCLGQTAREEADFLDMVAEGSETAKKAKRSCSKVDLEELLGNEEQPRLQEILVDLSLDTSDPARHQRLGSYYAQRSHWGLAEQAYDCALALDDRLATVWNNLGIVHLGQHNPAAAVRVLRRAVKIDPEYALAYFNLGMAYDTQHQYDQALDAYERAITLDPKLATVAHNPQVARNRHQTALFLRRLRHNQSALATSLDE